MLSLTSAVLCWQMLLIASIAELDQFAMALQCTDLAEEQLYTLHLNMGNVLKMPKRYPEAEHALQYALQYDVAAAGGKAYPNLGLTCYENGRFEEAMPCFAVQTMPIRSGSHLGCVFRELKRYLAPKAIMAHSESLIKAHPRPWRLRWPLWARRSFILDAKEARIYRMCGHAVARDQGVGCNVNEGLFHGLESYLRI